MLNLQWNHVSLYPAGYFTRRIPVQATATYPEGWTAVAGLPATKRGRDYVYRSEEHTSELQSLMRLSYAVFCLKKQTTVNHHQNSRPHHRTPDSHQTLINIY